VNEPQAHAAGVEQMEKPRSVQSSRATGLAALVIEKGLNPGEKVIVEGFFRVKPGTTVSACRWLPKLRRLRPRPLQEDTESWRVFHRSPDRGDGHRDPDNDCRACGRRAFPPPIP
jgi:hypothetical protein